MFDFFEDHPILFIILVMVGVIFLLGWAGKYEDEKLRECYFQEPRTAECEYKLWKYGARKNSDSHIVTVVPVRR